MSVDFFKDDCKEPSISLEIFGLCDNQDGSKAFADTDVANQGTMWIAEIKNKNKLDVIFTAIDKCVLYDNEYVGRGRCDGMLTTTDHLYLIELKNQKPPWKQDAIAQLRSTIKFLVDNHDLGKFKKRKAFACNKKRDKFAVIDNEFNKEFYRQTTFRIDIQSEVVIF